MKTTPEHTKRKTQSFVLLLVSVALALGLTHIFIPSANAQSTNQSSDRFPLFCCCHKAELAGKTCAHQCCISATAAGKLCAKCHPFAKEYSYTGTIADAERVILAEPSQGLLTTDARGTNWIRFRMVTAVSIHRMTNYASVSVERNRVTVDGTPSEARNHIAHALKLK